MCLSFIIVYVMPRASYRYIWSGFISSVVRRISNKFSSSLGVWELDLNMQNFYMHT